MSQQDVKKILETLRDRVANLNPTDESARKELSGLVDDIEKNLGSSGQGNSLSERVKTSALKFEVQHPYLTEIFNDLKSALYSLGL
ncbi:MAG: DUF4404 family protein [Candidatus Omnitrophica bacterium]|nr:DUF4404 family protein [Candidatus Omnitrophota bacterium]